MPMTVDGLDALAADIARMASRLDASGAGGAVTNRILEEAAAPQIGAQGDVEGRTRARIEIEEEDIRL